MEGKGVPACAKCSVKDKICHVERGEGPGFCPTVNYGKIIEKAIKEYEKSDIREFARMASIQ